MTPKSLRIRMYNVGFGDCFLLSFAYSDTVRRHVLIDFGTTSAPDGVDGVLMRVANDIRQETDGRLHAVIATHRHKDHISGFAPKKGGGGPGDIITSLKPEVVLLPWTEDPDAEEEARKPTRTSSRRGLHLRQLNDMHAVAASVLRFANVAKDRLPKSVRDRLAFLGEDNIRNVEAVRNLLKMGRKRRFLYFGANPGLGRVLPGVKVSVLGPPTLEQSDSIRKQRTRDANEFWMLAAKSAAAATQPTDRQRVLFAPKYRQRDRDASEETRWLTERMARIQAEQMLGIVTVLDNAMNNTSLILLMEVNGKKLLFPGDAQIENWEFALSKPSVVRALSDVDVYKVGHHGSRNATPTRLWNTFRRRSPEASEPQRLKTLLSTKRGKHGRTSENTEVPRRTLVDAMSHETTLYTTESSTQNSSGLAYEDLSVAF